MLVLTGIQHIEFLKHHMRCLSWNTTPFRSRQLQRQYIIYYTPWKSENIMITKTYLIKKQRIWIWINTRSENLAGVMAVFFLTWTVGLLADTFLDWEIWINRSCEYYDSRKNIQHLDYLRTLLRDNAYAQGRMLYRCKTKLSRFLVANWTSGSQLFASTVSEAVLGAAATAPWTK